MDGHQADALGARLRRRRRIAAAQGPHPMVGIGVASSVQRQRVARQGLQPFDHAGALAGRRAIAVTREQIAFAIDGVQRIMRKALLQQILPAPQGARQRGPARIRHGFLKKQPVQPARTPRIAVQLPAGQGSHAQRDVHQIGIVQPENRRFQRPRQRHIVARRNQRINQRHHILHLGRLGQLHLVRLVRRQADFGQRPLHRGDAVVGARNHQNVVGRGTRLHAALQPARRLAALALLEQFLLLHLGRGQAVAPAAFAGILRLFRAQDLRQRKHAPRRGRGRGVLPEILVAPLLLRRQHHRVDGIDHRMAVAARVVAAEHRTAEAGAHELLRCTKHLRIGAAEAVDALLGIAHDEHAGRRRHTGIAGQPGMQRLPLHRVGVLEFVHQQVAQLRIQPFLDPAAQQFILQQQARSLLDVVHVDPAVAALDLGVAAQQQAREARHALLVEPGLVLLLRLQHPQHPLLHGDHRIDLRNLVAELARGAFLGQQGRADSLPVVAADGLLQLHTAGSKAWCSGLRQNAGGLQQGIARHRPLQQRVHRMVAILHVREQLAKGRHRLFHHALRIRQHKLHPFGQCRFQRLERVAAPVAQHQCLIVRHCGGIAQQGLVERPPYFGHRTLVILQQFILTGQAQLLQQLQRRGAQQRCEPAVEGADLHTAAMLQQAQVQALQRRGLGPGLLRRHATQLQLLGQFLQRQLGKLRQPFVQALPHFGGSLLGEGDGQNLLRLGSRQQCPQDTADQHPCLAGAGAGLHHHMAGRIAGDGIESSRRHRAAIGGIGVMQRARHACSSSSQKSRRHRPRMAQ